MEEYVVNWGFLALTPYAVGLLVGVISLIVFTWREGLKTYLNGEYMGGFLALALLGGVAGARMLFVMLYEPDYYAQNLHELPVLQDGGMNFYGGLLAGYILIYLWAWKNNLSLSKYLDVLTPGLLLLIIFAHTGMLPQGKDASPVLPWALEMNGNTIHPDQAYFILLACVLLVFLWKKRREQGYYGELWAYFLMGLGFIDIFTGFYKIEGVMIGFVGFQQFAGILAVLLGIIFWQTGRAVIPQKSVYQSSQGVHKMKEVVKLWLMFLLVSGVALSLHVYFMNQYVV